MRKPLLPPALAALAALVVLAAARPASADTYDEAMALSEAAERRGDHAAAARALEAAVALYPQDHAIVAQLGLVYDRAGRFADAERAYRAAASLGPGSVEARLGLGWALVKQGRCADALAAFAEAKRLLPADGRAVEGERACAEPERRGIFEVFGGYHSYAFPSHPYKAQGVGALVSAGGVSAGGFSALAAFRHVSFTTRNGASPFTQDEGYAQLGVQREGYGFLLQAAVVADGSNVLGLSKHVGVSARLSPGGDLLLDASLSVYDDMTVGRVAPGYRFSLGGPARLALGLGLQSAGGEAFTSGQASLLLDWQAVSLWAGGKIGSELRPAYLGQLAVYDLQERVAGGAWAGIKVRPEPWLGFTAAYAYDRLEGRGASEGQVSHSHALTFGASFVF